MSDKSRNLLKWKAGEVVAQVDADVLLYSCAFAAQKTVWTHPDFKLGEFEGKKQLNDWCISEGIDPAYAVSTVVPEPFSHAKRAYTMTLDKVVRQAKADRAITYLTGKHNFRHDIAPDYKAHRKLVAKPYHYAKLKEHILAQPTTILVHGMEADDALGIAQIANHKATESSQWSVICTIDKDLDMIRGLHYNWNKDDLYYQAGGDAERCFYRQLITGDATDNIKGIPKKGKVSAEAALPDSMSDPWYMYSIVQNMYFEYENKIDNGRSSLAAVVARANLNLHKNAHLLWILRDPKEHWKKPTKPEVKV
jgi:hypothetical protein